MSTFAGDGGLFVSDPLMIGLLVLLAVVLGFGLTVTFVLWRLEQAGVADAAWTGDDTRTDAMQFYSNRRAFLAGEADFGRLMSAISLG